MNRKTRREEKKYRFAKSIVNDLMHRKTMLGKELDRRTRLIVNDLTNYLRASEKFIAVITEDEISEIVSFIIFFETIGKASNSKEEHHNLHKVMLYIASWEIYDEISTIYTSCEVDHYECYVCDFATYIDRYYEKIFTRFSTFYSIPKTTVGHHLILLSAVVMKREFKSLLAYVRFIKLTLFEKEGVYHFVSEEKQCQAKSWVDMQHNFQMKWNIYIQSPTPELIHVPEFPYSYIFFVFLLLIFFAMLVWSSQSSTNFKDYIEKGCNFYPESLCFDDK